MGDLAHAKISLPNGAAMPALGFGTLISDPVATKTAVAAAFQVCAERYRNEREVGAAIRETLTSGAVRRQDLFVTTNVEQQSST